MQNYAAVHSNVLTDFIDAAKNTHSYSDDVIEKYFERLVPQTNGDEYQMLYLALRSYRPKLFGKIVRRSMDDGSG